jgi:hypothetical protein
MLVEARLVHLNRGLHPLPLASRPASRAEASENTKLSASGPAATDALPILLLRYPVGIPKDLEFRQPCGRWFRIGVVEAISRRGWQG